MRSMGQRAGNLGGKVAIVTGGGAGLGLATARVLAAQGAAVAIFGRTAKTLQDAAAQLAAEGLSAFPVAVDLAGDEDGTRAAAARVETELGGIDVLVNNHAVTDPSVLARDIRVADLDPDLFASVFRVNVIGYAMAAKHCIPAMRRRGGGVIVNIGSAAGHSSEAVRPMYGSTKAAVLGLTRNIATHHARDRIRCVSVSLGPILSDSAKAGVPGDVLRMLQAHTLGGELGNPEQVGALVAYLASDVAALINGTDILADGGLLAHFPSWAEEAEWASGAAAPSTEVAL
jgi:NAD(P)-dependent dehydrogenase (short-subunit alcohol dehydrogenase family)